MKKRIFLMLILSAIYLHAGIGTGKSTVGQLPVELTFFTANIVNNAIYLIWETATEVNNYGFEIQRNSSETDFDGWQKIGFVIGHGNSNSTKEYFFIDKNLSDGIYQYRLKLIDTDGAFEYSDAIEVKIAAPEKFTLSQNHPNPFGKSSVAGNSFTTIEYSIPNVGDANFSSPINVQLKVYDALGREVATLMNEKQMPGNYEAKFKASGLPSGVYFYRLQAGNYAQTKKMLIIQ